MDSSPSKWREKLKGWVYCSHCGGQVFPWPNAVTHWLHETGEGKHEAVPLLHDLKSWDIERMGVSHARMGASILDNPYTPDGPLYDGADSMGEAAVWHRGWEAVQREMGRIPAKTEPVVVKSDDLDYLEFERD